LGKGHWYATEATQQKRGGRLRGERQAESGRNKINEKRHGRKK